MEGTRDGEFDRDEKITSSGRKKSFIWSAATGGTVAQSVIQGAEFP